jgi:ABC-type transport system substrate-binding protein
LGYAINKEQMRDTLFGGPEVFQVKGWDVTPSTIGYSPELDPFPYDPAKARQMLAEAGYPDGKGFGKVVLNTFVSPATPFLPESAQLVADYWKKDLGLDVEVKIGEIAAVKNQALLTEDFYGQMTMEDNQTRLDAATTTRNNYGTPGHGNRRHETPELFDMTQKAVGVIDPAERTAALNSLYRRLRDEAYTLHIGYMNLPWAVGPRVGAWKPWPLSPDPYNLHEITLK